MKKYITLFLLIFSVLFAIKAQAAGITINIDGKQVEYLGRFYDINVNGEILKSDVPAVIIEDRALVPVRAVFEKLGATVIWYSNTKEAKIFSKGKSVTLKINDKTAIVDNKKVTMDVPAKVINGRTMVPLRFVGEQLGYDVSWIEEESSVYIFEKPVNIVDVMYETGMEKSQIIVKADGKLKGFSTIEMANPYRLAVNLPATKFNLPKKNEIEVGKASIDKIQIEQFREEPAISRLTVNLSEWPAYKVTLSSDERTLIIEFVYKTSTIKDVRTLRQGSMESVLITLDLFHGHIVSKMYNPERIVVDLPNTVISKLSGHLEVNGRHIKAVRYAQYKEKYVRVIIDLAGESEYEIFHEDSKLVIRLFDPPVKNLNYYNDKNGIRFEIDGYDLTGKYSQNLKPREKICTFAFPTSVVDIGSGVMNINDEDLNYVDIRTDSNTNTTQMIISAKHMYKFTLTGDKNKKKTIISLAKIEEAVPAKKGEILVVIDPGHGGSEPGAIVGELKEKNFNLDISIRLNKLLISHGVKTYITRDEDVDVGLYSRAEIANELNATLFISVHNNAIDDPNYGGTMSLYFPEEKPEGEFTGKRFAEIVQEKLLKKLGTKDRKIIPRPNLVVLRETDMPAVLAEVAFMTHRPDLELLLREDFRQNAAEALCEAVLQALQELKAD